MDVYQTIVKVLEEIGVDHVFGGSGQVNASMLLALNKSDKIKTQNEQAASFMAAGYGMFSKKLGVCFATGGPGAFNLFSGLAVAYSDSIPMLGISGYPSRYTRGKGALNETSGLSRTPDSQKMFAATTKKSVVLEDAKDTIPVLEELIYTAFEGRPGPVHLHIPPKFLTIARLIFPFRKFWREKIRRKNFARASSKISKPKTNRCSWSATVVFAPTQKKFWKN